MELRLLAILGVIAQALLDIQTEMKTMSDQQAELNTDVANLVAAVAAVSAELDTLKSANPELDLSGLETAIGSLQALAPPPAAPPAS